LPIHAVDNIHRYSTANAGRRAHVAYWNGLLRDLVVPLKVTAADPTHFEAELSVGQFGTSAMADVRSSPANVDYDINHVGLINEHFYSLQMAVEGRCHFRVFGNESVLEPGDLVLNDSHVPSQIQFDEPARILSIRIQPSALGTYVPETEQFLGVQIRGAHVMGGLLGRMLMAFWEQIGAGMPPDLAPPLEQSLLQVLASYFAIEHGPQYVNASTAALRRTQIKRYVESHLTDPELAANSIAAGLGVSPRFVFRAFAGERESLADYVQRRRLEQISIYLKNPLWSHWTITQIAMHWGFASVPHFSRVFKGHFSETPGAFRRRHAI
jgi:AraC-like DNA-binding protein